MASSEITLFVLVAVAGLLTESAFTRIKLRSALIAAERSLETQFRISEERIRQISRIERDKQLRANIEEAYSHLGGWLWELDLAIDGMVVNVYSEDNKLTQDTLSEIESWHWWRLRPPKTVASMQHYWSSDVHERVNKIYEHSQPFVGEVKTAIAAPAHQSGRNGDLLTNHDKLWERRNNLQSSILAIRKQMHDEISKVDT